MNSTVRAKRDPQRGPPPATSDRRRGGHTARRSARWPRGPTGPLRRRVDRALRLSRLRARVRLGRSCCRRDGSASPSASSSAARSGRDVRRRRRRRQVSGVIVGVDVGVMRRRVVAVGVIVGGRRAWRRGRWPSSDCARACRLRPRVGNGHDGLAAPSAAFIICCQISAGSVPPNTSPTPPTATVLLRSTLPIHTEVHSCGVKPVNHALVLASRRAGLAGRRPAGQRVPVRRAAGCEHLGHRVRRVRRHVGREDAWSSFGVAL